MKKINNWPDRLYKYRSLDENTFNIFKNNELFFFIAKGIQ
jgi:hypothetical protein